MSYLSELHKIRKMQKQDAKLKRKNFIKKNIPSFLVFFVLTLIFFISNLINNSSAFNFKYDKLFLTINLMEKLTCPVSENDLDNALNKLNDVGLTAIASRTTFTYLNLQNNEQIPNFNLVLTNAEFASLLIPIFYTIYGSSNNLYEIAITPDENGFEIVTTFSFNFNFNYANFKINEDIYYSQIYALDDNMKISFVRFEYLNINPEYIKETNIESTQENNYKEDEMHNFLSFVFTKNESYRTFIELFNYTDFSYNNDLIVLY